MHKTVEKTPVYNAGIQGNEAAVSRSMPKVHDSKLDSPVSTYPSLNINQSTEEKATTRTWLLEDYWISEIVFISQWWWDTGAV